MQSNLVEKRRAEMKKKIQKKIIGWSAFYLCIILVGLLVVHATGNQSDQVAAAADKAESEPAAKAVSEDESGMIYLDADAAGTLTEGDAGDVPVSVKVTYYLNDQSVSADEIAGKSGNIKIRFDYENLVQKEVQIGDKIVSVNVPFMVLSAAVMPTDIFSNVEVSNGKVMTEDDRNIVVGTAFPGWKESLKLDSIEEMKDINLPNYVEITADAQNFELDFTASIISLVGMDELDTEKLNDAEDLTGSMDELSEASTALVDGTGTLLSGMRTYQTAITSYTEGTAQLQNGIRAINSAMAQFTALGDDGTAAIMTAAQALAADAQSLCEGMISLQTNLNGLPEFLARVKEYQNTVEAAKEAKATATVDIQNAKAVLSGMEESDSKTAIAALDDAQTQLNKVDAVGTLDIPNLTVDTGSIMTILGDMQNQLTVLAGFSENMSGLSDGITQLSASLSALQTGADQLTSYNTQLLEGIGALTEGTGSLREGMVTLDKEGIQKLKDLAGDDLQNVLNRVKALKEAEAQYKREHAGADGEAGSYVIETASIAYDK